MLQVARGILQELDFRNEARNAVVFAQSLEHLGYVTVPKTLAKYSGPPALRPRCGCAEVGQRFYLFEVAV